MRSVIEEAFLRDIAEARYGSEPEAMATEMAGGMEPEGAKPMTIKQFATTAADVPAGLLKGSIQGSVGLGGDLISLGRGIVAAMNPNQGEDRVDAFLRGLDLPTGLPTSEDVKKFLDDVIGPVVPAGVQDEKRREMAKVPENIGELFSAGKVLKEGAKRTARKATEKK
jgi:hypothetical protein